MSTTIIAATYKIEKKLGSGGGGVVYLAEHLRLHKKVVLKADKRTLHKTNTEMLRQEVDVLKNLSHTYIPQVYDFFVDGDTVYTVIDYIEGESLEKPLQRGERFSQPQVVEWACQLLEALCYLHAQPPHGILHADIKPANIMLTPQGDIRLIDFNIALALGEAGAVKIGFSRGYASPEHYGQTVGLDNSSITTRRVGMFQTVAETEQLQDTELLPVTEILSETELLPETELLSETEPLIEKVQIMPDKPLPLEHYLDVRSDIYSLGAALYHLLTGKRPVDAAEGQNVQAATEFGCSKALSDILAKAMAINPAERYQTAAEMLYAFEHLHENDPRSKCLRRWRRLAATACVGLLLVGAGLTWTGLSELGHLQNAYVLAEYSANAMREGDVPLALMQAQQSLNGSVTAQGQKALTEALGVYDLADGYKAKNRLDLPSEPIKITIAPNGETAAVLFQNIFYVYDIVSGELLAELPTINSVAADMVFASDNLLFYTGADGVAAYDLIADQKIWQGQLATKLALSADGRRLAAVYRQETQAQIYDTVSGQLMDSVDFAGRSLRQPINDNFADTDDVLLALNHDGSWLAVSFADGGMQLFEVGVPKHWLLIFDKSDFTHFEGGFAGHYLAFAAQGSGQNVFAVIDVNKESQTGGYQSANPFHVQADERGIYLSNENLLVQIEPESGVQQELAYTTVDIQAFTVDNGTSLLALTDNSFSFYDNKANSLASFTQQYAADFLCLAGDYALTANRNVPALQILQLEQHPEAQLLAYDADFEHDEARLSADKKTVMLFDFMKFRIYDLSGNMLAERNLPADKQVYDQQYRREGDTSYLEVIYYDGTVQKYSATDGSLLEEKQMEPPNPELYEEFLTDKYRIASPLHGAPQVFDRQSGKLLQELSGDAFLTYVTQLDKFLLTEYVAADGRRWGILLDENLAEIAYLPGLCDMLGEEVIFDYKSGYLRMTKLYALNELLALAENRQ